MMRSGKTHQQMPPAGQRQRSVRAGRRRGGIRNLDRAREDDHQDEHVRRRDDQELDAGRLEQLARGGDRGLEAEAMLVADDAARDEVADDRVQLRRADGFREHEERRGDEIARMHRHLGHEVRGMRLAGNLGLDEGEQDERRPSDENREQGAALGVQAVRSDETESLQDAGGRRVFEEHGPGVSERAAAQGTRPSSDAAATPPHRTKERSPNDANQIVFRYCTRSAFC